MSKNPVPWPNGARCPLAFTFDMDAATNLHPVHLTSAHTRVAALSTLLYAVPRYEAYGSAR
jgi:peptidoglycan-N-acetylglucosamine deacetylase